jgi:hypothetical protein
MASRTVTYVDDDIDGGPAAESVSFSLDGVTYAIDLNAANARALRDAVAPYVAVARRTAGQRTSARGRSRTERKELAEIRAWAREHGYAVNDKGRMSAEIHDAYRAARAARSAPDAAAAGATITPFSSPGALSA